jgi:hypothetical protein|tara:strand:- start:184 stop:354 length:171 start_codon:yes stop_codon:yes gene_type:complete
MQYIIEHRANDDQWLIMESFFDKELAHKEFDLLSKVLVDIPNQPWFRIREVPFLDP